MGEVAAGSRRLSFLRSSKNAASHFLLHMILWIGTRTVTSYGSREKVPAFGQSNVVADAPFRRRRARHRSSTRRKFRSLRLTLVESAQSMVRHALATPRVVRGPAGSTHSLVGRRIQQAERRGNSPEGPAPARPSPRR